MQSLGGSRAVIALATKVLIVAALVAAVPLLYFQPFGARHHPTVEIHDEAGVLQVAPLQEQLEDLKFREEVDLAVLTLPDDGIDNFNLTVLEWARANQPDWISAKDANYWADGLVILAVSPDGRWVGTYFGEDVKVDLPIQEDIQEAGKDAFRSADWAGGVQDMADKAADVVGRPFQVTLSTLVLPMLGAVGGLGWLLALVSARNKGRDSFAAAQRHYSSVTTDWDATEVLARTIPDDEPHGAQVLARFEWFQKQYHELTAAFNDFGTPRGAAWYNTRMSRKAADLKRRASELDSLDDTIAHTSALLTMSSTWAEAWDNELGPIHEDLGSLEELCDTVDERGVGVSTGEERTWIRYQRQTLAAMTAELGEGRRTPSSALDALDAVADQVRERARALANRAIDADDSAYAAERREAYRDDADLWGSGVVYTGSWGRGGQGGSYSPASTIRINPSSPGATAAGLPGSATRFEPVAGLVTGYSSASSYTPSSSSSSSGGGSSYGGGGGGFSGAGSSSRF